MTKKEFCKKFDLTEGQFNGSERIGGSLDLESLTSIPEGFNPTVGRYLDLSALTSIPEGFNPMVGGYLDLESLTSIPEGFNPTVGGYLDLSALTSIPGGFNPTVGGSLYLDSLTSIPGGFNPMVGGGLDLRSLTSIPEGFNPMVGGSLDLSALTSIPEGFNPMVGGSLDLKKLLRSEVKSNPLPENYVFDWGKYCKIDGIFTEVLSRKGLVWKVKKIMGDTLFVVTDGNGKYAHGETVKKAKESLIYKIKDRDTSRYAGISLDTKLPFPELVEMYRVITGACAFGTQAFVESHGIAKRAYTIKEMVALTEGQYGNQQLVGFFK